ncbi:VOC family protein [Pararobbsia silviterrae]|uniref:Glyoxalase n=1 Tax=Pararobbsia silviterrae TaxID=1792498 RepID=A0A494XZT9_9BURK|nr:VOC family protein [Pararobbsia silviterrae]RKP53621.1 glyoxalase [Pararobbsia silviterrae]
MTTLQKTSPARFHHIRVLSDQPERLVAFYERMLDLRVVGRDASGIVMTGPARGIIVGNAGSDDAPYYAYAVRDRAALDRLAQRLGAHAVDVSTLDDPLFEAGAVRFADPQGRRFVFGVAKAAPGLEGAPARLQHTVFQSTDLENVVRFFVDAVGFTLSDEVVDDDGRLMVAFLRSDDEHHTLAFFRGSRDEWDHHCYETNEWNDIRDWGDRFAQAEIPIFFGPGRHGPGNNLFFMVTDPDGNRLEFSAELERVDADKAPGVWPQSERTLNSWGRAWIRT